VYFVLCEVCAFDEETVFVMEVECVHCDVQADTK